MIKRISESFQAALKYPLVCLLVIIVVRFLTLGFPALTDPSEARYAAIAQQMVVSNHWLVPQINLGAGQEPFWGKPPLHFWLTAISFSIFGFTESAARLPALLAALGITVLIFAFCRRFFSRETALTALLVMFSSFIFILLSGASMTDMTLTLAITGSLVSFAFATHSHAEKANYWGYAFFLFLAIGMLTKGPIAIVFSGAKIGRAHV